MINQVVLKAARHLAPDTRCIVPDEHRGSQDEFSFDSWADHVRDAVAQAWEEAIAPLVALPGQTWEELGGDSQASVYLLSSLEDRLGTPIPFDVLTSEMTIESLAHSLLALGDHSSLPNRHTVFLVPGIGGDTPQLAGFRRLCRGGVNFATLELPGPQDRKLLLASIDETARVVCRQIVLRQNSGPIFLAGYSFGGIVAFQAARFLYEANREVVFLGILDARIDSVGNDASKSPNWLVAGMDAIIRPAWRSDLIRPSMMLMMRRHFRRAWVHLSRQILTEFRHEAQLTWRACPIETPASATVLVALSEENVERNREPWTKLLPDGRVMTFEGDHHSFLRSSQLAMSFTAAVSAARR